MKKYFLSLAVATLSLGFTACEDVPAPYEVNGDGSNTGSSVILDEKFSTSLGDFSAINTEGSYSWNCSYSCAQVTSFVDSDGNGQKEDMPAESWLISPKMDFTSVDSAYVSFDYILRYANASELESHYQVLVSKDFNGVPTQANWTALPFKAEQGTDWDTWYNTGKLSIPAEMMKQPGVTVALRYKTTKKAATWEVKNFKVMKGNGEENPGGGGGDKPVEPTGKNLLENAGFEDWTDGVPNAWKSTNSASNATLTQSTTARNGKFALAVEGNEAQNKRLASKEYTLKAGTYTFTLNVKGDGQVRLGYAIVEADGSIAGGDSYKYGSYTSTTAGDWTEASYTFTLTEQTKVNLVMMNPKTTSYATASEKLVDDASLVTSDGGIVEGGDQGGDQGDDQPQAGNLLENADFELWTGDAPTAWKSTNSASNATLTQSTTARSGKLAVAVGFDEKQNKRLASKEYTLKAGTYTFTLYVKGDGQVRPGHAIVEANGSIAGGDSYKYGGYTSTTAGEWTKVTYEFTLTEQTKVNLIMMNPKTTSYATASEKLVDDASLTTTDGGIVG